MSIANDKHKLWTYWTASKRMQNPNTNAIMSWSTNTSEHQQSSDILVDQLIIALVFGIWAIFVLKIESYVKDTH